MGREFFSAVENMILGQLDIVEHHLCGVGGADTMFLHLCHLAKPLVPAGMTNMAWLRVPNSVYTDATTMRTLPIPLLIVQVVVPLRTYRLVVVRV